MIAGTLGALRLPVPGAPLAQQESYKGPAVRANINANLTACTRPRYVRVLRTARHSSGALSRHSRSFHAHLRTRKHQRTIPCSPITRSLVHTSLAAPTFAPADGATVTDAAALERILAGCASTALEPIVCAAPSGSGADAASGPAGGDDALTLYDDNGSNGRITCAEARRHGIALV